MRTWTWTCDDCGVSEGPYFSEEAARLAMAVHCCQPEPEQPAESIGGAFAYIHRVYGNAVPEPGWYDRGGVLPEGTL